MKLVAHPVREQIAALRVAAGPHPKKKADFRGKTQSLDELRQEKRETLVIMGNREALNHVVDGVANRKGEEGKTLHQQMSLKAGVTGKQFVPAIAS